MTEPMRPLQDQVRDLYARLDAISRDLNVLVHDIVKLVEPTKSPAPSRGREAVRIAEQMDAEKSDDC